MTAPQRYPAPLSNPDNSAAKQEEYCAFLALMDDAALETEAERKIWLSGFAANNPRSYYHWHADACYDTAPFTSASTPRCFKNTKAAHMVSKLPGRQGTDELILFARRLGLNPGWIQHPGTADEHFDLTEGKHAQALRLGARQVSSRELLEAEVDRDSLPGAYPARMRLRLRRAAQ